MQSKEFICPHCHSDNIQRFEMVYRNGVSITPTFKIPINFEMFQAYTKFLKNIFGFIVDGVIPTRNLR